MRGGGHAFAEADTPRPWIYGLLVATRELAVGPHLLCPPNYPLTDSMPRVG
jgi:hypothetical protein